MPQSGDAQSGATGAEAWKWWEARRLRYNLALALAGWIAYGLGAAISYGFDRPIWQNWSGAVGMTLFLGVGFLVLMGIANICYLAGAFVESALKPADVNAYRKSAYALGFWGSVAIPFLFPLSNLALYLAAGPV